MPTIRPFRALRPTPEYAARVASPPYDVLSSDEARAMVRDNPFSFLRVNKPEVDFDSSVDVHNHLIYDKGKENLGNLIGEGVMIRDEQPSLYLYRLTWREKSQTGLVTLTSVADYEAGLIKKHEHTRPEKVSDRADHIMTLGAQVGPVFSIFKQTARIRELFDTITSREPGIDFTADDSVRHQLWVVDDDSLIEQFVESFGALSEFYIADGHHRSEAASEVCRRMKEKNPDHSGNELYNYFLNVLFPDSELRILPYNRVIKEIADFSAASVVDKAKDKFEIAAAEKPLELKQEHEIGFYSGGEWQILKAREGSFDQSHAVESIDASILYDNLLRPILGINDIRTDNRIDFVGGIRGDKELEKLVDSGEWQAAFSLRPVTVQQLLDVADASEIMPPKSTWFEPKLRSGMFVNIITEE